MIFFCKYMLKIHLPFSGSFLSLVEENTALYMKVAKFLETEANRINLTQSVNLEKGREAFEEAIGVALIFSPRDVLLLSLLDIIVSRNGNSDWRCFNLLPYYLHLKQQLSWLAWDIIEMCL